MECYDQFAHIVVFVSSLNTLGLRSLGLRLAREFWCGISVQVRAARSPRHATARHVTRRVSALSHECFSFSPLDGAMVHKHSTIIEAYGVLGLDEVRMLTRDW